MNYSGVAKNYGLVSIVFVVMRARAITWQIASFWICAVLQLLVLQPAVNPETQKGSSLKELLCDPYILVAAGLFVLYWQNSRTHDPEDKQAFGNE